MAGVYNRKLFRQNAARDELRKMGGIMASSEELLREAMRTAMQAPGPSDLGPMPMPMPQQPAFGMPAQPVMPQQPMMQQPMAPMPMDMGMQQPMMQPQQPMVQPQQPMDMGMGVSPQPMMQQQPIQPAIAEPAFMPPTMPQSAQMQPMQPQGFFLGGLVNVAPALGMGGTEEDVTAKPPRPNPARSIGLGATTVDIGQPAGSVGGVDVDESLTNTALAISERLDEEPPYAVANRILEEARRRGVETTSDKAETPEAAEEAMKFDLAKILEEMTGDPAAYEKNIDELNRGIIGAAIGAGTSARATENISKGLLVGLEAAQRTEERRAADARALQLEALKVRAAEQAARVAEEKAAAKAKAEAEAELAEAKRDVYNQTFEAIIRSGINNVTVPKGMSIEDYAAEVAREQVEANFPSAPPTLEEFMAATRASNPGMTLTDEVLTEYYNSEYGG